LSPIAEILAAHEGGDLLHAISGGLNPAREIFPLTWKIISEIGPGLQGQRPKRIPPEVLERYHSVVGINSSRQEVLLDSKKGRFKEWRIEVEQPEDLQGMRQTRNAVHRLVSVHLAEFGIGFKKEPEQ
jgi:protein-tyrosine-phosphatase